MSVKLKPLHNVVVIENEELVKVSEGGIVLVKGNKVQAGFGTVLDFGSGVYDNKGKLINCGVKVGDRIAYRKGMEKAFDLNKDGKPTVCVKANDILGIMPKEQPKVTLLDGSPLTPDYREIREDGMQKNYAVLSAEERSKGFVRPVRRSYVHTICGGVTTMGVALAETYARNPSFYNGTFCAICRKHFPVGVNGEFIWDDETHEKVGT
jgi:co-chaperonin GroES (HSP10)